MATQAQILTGGVATFSGTTPVSIYSVPSGQTLYLCHYSIAAQSAAFVVGAIAVALEIDSQQLAILNSQQQSISVALAKSIAAGTGISLVPMVTGAPSVRWALMGFLV